MKNLTITATKYKGKQIGNEIYVLDINILNQERLNKDILYYIPISRVFVLAPVEADLLSNLNKKENKIKFTADITEHLIDDNIVIEMLSIGKTSKNNFYMYRLQGNNVWHPISESLYKHINRG
ncbi:MAG: hypothetical protein ROM03_05365 [Mucispirillum sp.]|nr:hypothetical protein [Mucispirillum sp.]